MDDISGKIGPLFPIKAGGEAEWPMYSFERPAWKFWNGVASGLKAKGYSEEETKEWLQSKKARWFLDEFDDKLFELGEQLALKMGEY